MPTSTVLVLQHAEVEKPGLVLEALHGCDVEVRNLLATPDASANDLPSTADLAGLVVMGGPMNANDTAGYPALRSELDLLSEALRAEVPTLGICLGAQLLARAGGLTVRSGAGDPREWELGWAPLRDVDRRDPVVGPLADAPGLLHWHRDRIVPEADTHLLASTKSTPCQAFRAGPAAWGVQFHLEITIGLLDDWLAEPSFVADVTEAHGPGAVDQLRADARALVPALRPSVERGLRHLRSLILDRTAR
ncbi:type 1 glutamine amidotransferase [Streptantibioticus ferralitis]|uniref:Type 1 glutamine amidotransferase n=1 Tax=Streptantibioticus ferralitis TaxID=236510 RepID=A0ABT5YYI8_9ACTN|nr:type 1 glutamine amidotransferase [Streptantibioticus ferralitis]MDF2256657.1 type 1 glutamine amidotransferase [Streptantibioticus ferralitis]